MREKELRLRVLEIAIAIETAGGKVCNTPDVVNTFRALNSLVENSLIE